MKVLHINTDASHGGAAKAACRIHEALLKESVDSYFYAAFPNVAGKRILYGSSNSRAGRIYLKIRKFLARYYESTVKKVFSNDKHVIVSLGMGSMLNRDFIEEFNPDIIHLHWICNSFISLNDIKWLGKYPLVWTLHDTWAFTGGCHYNEECQKYKDKCTNCHLFQPRFGIDLAKILFNQKKVVYSNTNIKVVGCSRWIADLARKSMLFSEKDVYCVPNTLNNEVFKPKDKLSVRKILGLSQEKKIILFGAMDSTSDRRKGFQFLHGAIQYLLKNRLSFYFELMVFGSNEPENPLDFGVPVHYMGRFGDDLSLSMIYSAADVMLVPSLYENFPNTGLESLNCGTPVVAFRIGGIPDQIDHKVNGYLADPYDSEDLASGIAYILEDEERWQQMSKAARKKAEECFNEKRIAQEYIKVYQAALTNNSKHLT